MIKVENLTKKYRSHTVLEDVSFRILGGEFVFIIGNSGAGKSTLIHALIGAEPINQGNISIDNYDVTALSGEEVQEYRRRIGIVFQDYKLLPQKTVFENVAFALEVSGFDDDFIQKRVIDVLKLTGLEGHRNHFPNQLSGGEKQRTAIARALVHAPELLFADEPTGNLDPENTLALAQLFDRINKSGTTVVISTHSKTIVNSLKKRVIKLDKGKMVGDKKTSEYY